MKNLGIVLAALGGIAAGATLGMLFAPQKGSDTRAYIKKLLKTRAFVAATKRLMRLLMRFLKVNYPTHCLTALGL